MALRYLTGLREFADNRDRLLQAFYGVKLKRSYLRDEMIRTVLIEFGHGRYQNIKFYGRQCSHFASLSAVRIETEQMLNLGVFTVYESANQREIRLAPTQRLIDYYNKVIPALEKEVLDLLLGEQVADYKPPHP